MRFVDRTLEMAALARLYATPGFQFVPVYGRRRVGKTRLLREFIRGRDAIYYLAENVAEGEQLRGLGRAIGEHFGDRILADAGFRDWRQFFSYVDEKSTGRLALIIDEFPYLVYSTPGVASIFQKGIDERLSSGNLFLVLMGSSIGMMEREVLQYKAPLYGRRTAALEVREMPFPALHEFFPNTGFDDLVRIFAVFGTIPAYLEKVAPGRDVFANINDLILSPASYLRNEVEFLLMEELREPRHYFVILRALAQGKRRVSEIMNETGLDKSMVSRYLDILKGLRFIEREVPVTEKSPEKSKLGLYAIHDRFISFWFNYILPNRSRLEIGDPAFVMALIRRDFEKHVSRAFEAVCRDLCAGLMHDGIMSYTRLGRWWSKEAEIDLVALDENDGTAWFGECKWSRNPIGEDIYRDLAAKSALIEWRGAKGRNRYILFGKSGFTPGMKRLARAGNVILMDRGKMVK